MKGHPGAVPRALTGTIAMPGDKSISHRALILAALASGPTVVAGINTGRDVLATGGVLSALGADCAVDLREARVEVHGSGQTGLRRPHASLDCSNSGSTLRMVLGVCAGIEGPCVLTGDPSLRRRPMLRVVTPLRTMGATIDGPAGGDRAPLTVRGGNLTGIDFEMEVASAQVKSAVLLAGLAATGTTTVTQPGITRDHTERMLAAAGVAVAVHGNAVTVRGGDAPSPGDRRVPGDVSAAAFFGVAASLIAGSDVTIQDLGLNPTRTAWMGALRRMGADLDSTIEAEWGGEPAGRLRTRFSPLVATEISGAEIPNLIDEIPALAVAATQAQGTTVVSGAGELRVKESDRIETLVRGLGSLGADVEARADGMVIRGPTPLHGGRPNPKGDHRAAMAFAVAGLVADGEVQVPGWDCVATSFPGFSSVMRRVVGEGS